MGEAPSSPQPPEGGGPQGQALRRLVRRRESEPTDNVVKPVRVPVGQCGVGSGSADFKHVADLPLAARCGLAASFRAFDLPLTDMREDGAEMLVLDDGGLRDLPQLVKSGVRQVEPAAADRQPAVGIIDDGDALAAELDAFEAQWGRRYPAIGQAWRRAWEHVVPLFAFPPAIRKMIYTTNAVESLHRSLRKIIKTRGSFPTDEAALKLLFLAIRNAGLHWRRPIEWTAAMGQFAILFGERFEVSAR